MQESAKKILFITGTRADFGKMKSLILKMQSSSHYEVTVFVTGMHLLKKFGDTWTEIAKSKIIKIYKFKNQNYNQNYEKILINTLQGLQEYMKYEKTDLVFVHGDRVEALAAAMLSAFKNIPLAHIEGGEVSGTIDEPIRHSISKFSNLHFVSNQSSKKRLIQLGENKKNIYVVGSPEVHYILNSKKRNIEAVKKYYEINFTKYCILIYHPVHGNIKNISKEVSNVINVLKKNNIKTIIIYPNNEPGNKFIINEYNKIKKHKNFKIFPSIRFESYISLLKNSLFIIGNSSSGVREAPSLHTNSINIGSRQNNRNLSKYIRDIKSTTKSIENAIKNINVINSYKSNEKYKFGKGKPHEKIFKIIDNLDISNIDLQKEFIDIKKSKNLE